MDINVELPHNEQDIARYFQFQSNWIIGVSVFVFFLGWIFTTWWLGLIVAVALGAFIYYKLQGSVTDSDIDQMWHTIAKSREDEAYRATNYDKEDAIRDAIYFFGVPEQKSPDKQILVKQGKDELLRCNHQKLVYMIFGRDQLIVFDETICLENKWDGADQTNEFYWEDVSSVSFDEKADSLTFTVGPRTISYPLTGEDEKRTAAYSQQAQQVANAVRLILRERKSSR